MKKRLFLLLLAAIVLPSTLMAQPKASLHIDSTVNACTSYTWTITGETFTESGIHTALIGDTLFILDLNIHPVYNVTVPETVQGGCSYTWGDTTLLDNGTYTRTFRSVDNCDSNVTITLSISGQAVKGYTVTACESYTWKDSTFTESTVYLHEENANNCDSLLTLNLTIIEPEQKSGDTAVSACSFIYFNFHPNQSPIRFTQDTLLNSDATGFPLNDYRGRNVFHPRTVQKCYDSVVYAHITIKQKVIENFSFFGCDRYTFENEDTTIVYEYSRNDSINWGKAANGCDSIYKIAVTIKKKPVVYISGDLRVMPNQTATLHANSDQTVTYTWDYNNSHADSITTEPLTHNTDITLTGKNTETTCEGVSSVTILVTTEGIDGAEGSLLRIYPNPTSDIININAEKSINNVTVFNINGQQVRTVRNSDQVDMRGLANGNYVIRIELEDGSVATGTVVKK